MNNKVLFVDDDEIILSTYHRLYHNRYDLQTAGSGADAINIINEQGPFAVVVSDYQMPDMDGIKLLSLVKEAVPDTVRILFTGNAELKTAIKAVNEGNIFRFITKPCENAELEGAIISGLRQYELIMAEKELLQLKGLLAMCCSCKKIRDEKGTWHHIESYIETHSTASVSHTYCPDCFSGLYPEVYEKMKKDWDQTK